MRYGRGLGGVAVVTSRTGRRDRWRAGGELSLIHAAAIAEGPGPLARQLADRRAALVLRRDRGGGEPRPRARARATATRSCAGSPATGAGWRSCSAPTTSCALIHDPNDTSVGRHRHEQRQGVRLHVAVRAARRCAIARSAARRSVTILPSVGIDDVNGRANHNDIDKGLHRTTVPITLRAEVATPLAGGTLSVGLDGGGSGTRYDMLNTPPPTPARSVAGHGDPPRALALDRRCRRVARAVVVRRSATGSSCGPALRGDHFGLSDQWTLDPRVVVHEQLPHGIALTQSVGVYHEPPLITDLDPIFGDRADARLGGDAGRARRQGDRRRRQRALRDRVLPGPPRSSPSTRSPPRRRSPPTAAPTRAACSAISRELVDTQFGSYSYREAIGNGRRVRPRADRAPERRHVDRLDRVHVRPLVPPEPGRAAPASTRTSSTSRTR